MEDWMRGLSNKNATIFGVIAILLGIFIFSFLSRSMIGSGIMGAAIAIGFMLLHKGFTGKTLKEKQEDRNQ